MGDFSQTPGIYMLAGGSGFFNADCVKALAKCGLHPDDFGSYETVKERIRAAKRKKLEHKEARKRGDSKSASELDAHDRFLARSEAGHLRQNAIFQHKRGDSCRNEPGALGYHSGLAPSVPHPGTATKEGTTHWAVTEHDKSLREGAAPGTPLSTEQIKNHSLKNSEITARGPASDAVSEKGRGPKVVRTNELKARKESATALDPENAGKVDAPKDKTIAEEDAKKAAECIEAFTDGAFEAMRDKVMQDYGPDYDKTKERLQKAEEDALKAKNDAKKKLDEAKAGRQEEPDNNEYKRQEREAYTELAQASQDYSEAQHANSSAPCLREQVAELQKMKEKGQPLPKMKGSVPPGPGQKRPVPEAEPTPTEKGIEEF